MENLSAALSAGSLKRSDITSPVCPELSVLDMAHHDCFYGPDAESAQEMEELGQKRPGLDGPQMGGFQRAQYVSHPENSMGY